jgi:hypothetical protein
MKIQFEIYIADKRNIPDNRGLHRMVFEMDASEGIKKITVEPNEYPMIPFVHYFTTDGEGHEAQFVQDEGDIVFLA